MTKSKRPSLFYVIVYIPSVCGHTKSTLKRAKLCEQCLSRLSFSITGVSYFYLKKTETKSDIILIALCWEKKGRFFMLQQK
jgi:hypothetical protein